MAESSFFAVTLVYSAGPRQVREWSLHLAQGATVGQAIEASGLREEFPELPQELSLGIWGRKVPPQQALRDADRVEIYRPLGVDPKLARRERFRKQGARAAGLFARKRAGAKAGY
ncbi:RnfH family protein [Caenimonas aquaedulcis]|uniref:UPF0125 protein I5803_02875 n=1 Tax=Caenimonas aquaedulcis TaxID=2793270 RepID=A0A931MF05_9BURK|nr:RnfH family protein [Caenimonas aquaedulcis]MBG9386958.1 RnfH family protein [Caenimonas aquaedulcis]